jgi:hypothetical protein
MDDYEKLERLLSEGYLVAEPVYPLRQLNRQSIDEFVCFFHVETAREALLDPCNQDKLLVILGHPNTGNRVEILASDEVTITRVNKQLDYQRERIGTVIGARCVVVDNSSRDRQTCHGLDRLVASLDGFQGWRFTLLGSQPPTFGVEMKLESTDTYSVEECKEKLRRLLDYLAYSQRIGFHIQDLVVGPIRRSSLNPYFLATGPEERMLDAVTPKEIAGIESILVSPKARAAARGLNQAYVENYMPSRLSMLWATVEDVFSTKPQPLLSQEERNVLLDQAEHIATLKVDRDRLDRLKEALSNPDRLPKKGRNQRIAHRIAPIMGISKEEAYSELTKTSRLRAKNVHKLSRDGWNTMEASIRFLEQVLRCYLEKQMGSKV